MRSGFVMLLKAQDRNSAARSFAVGGRCSTSATMFHVEHSGVRLLLLSDITMPGPYAMKFEGSHTVQVVAFEQPFGLSFEVQNRSGVHASRQHAGKCGPFSGTIDPSPPKRERGGTGRRARLRIWSRRRGGGSNPPVRTICGNPRRPRFTVHASFRGHA